MDDNLHAYHRVIAYHGTIGRTTVLYYPMGYVETTRRLLSGDTRQDHELDREDVVHGHKRRDLLDIP